MNKLNINALAVAIGLAFCASAMAQSAKTTRTINAEYKADRAACKSMTGTAKTSCRAEAKAKRTSARAAIAATPPAKYSSGRRDQAADAAADAKRGPIENPKR